MDRAERIGQLLLARGWRVSVAESTAGGLISAALLKVAGASRYYERGVVAYSELLASQAFHATFHLRQIEAACSHRGNRGSLEPRRELGGAPDKVLRRDVPARTRCEHQRPRSDVR